MTLNLHLRCKSTHFLLSPWLEIYMLSVSPQMSAWPTRCPPLAFRNCFLCFAFLFVGIVLKNRNVLLCRKCCRAYQNPIKTLGLCIDLRSRTSWVQVPAVSPMCCRQLNGIFCLRMEVPAACDGELHSGWGGWWESVATWHCSSYHQLQAPLLIIESFAPLCNMLYTLLLQKLPSSFAKLLCCRNHLCGM